MNFQQIRSRARSSWEEFTDPDRPRVLVGAGTCGRAAGAEEVLKAVRAWMEESGTGAPVYEVGCLGLCYAEPLVELSAPGMPAVLYGNLSAEDVGGLLRDYFERSEVRPDLAIAVMDGEGAEGIPAFGEHPMMAGQMRIVLRNCGLIDPENIDHYIARGGYDGLATALEMSPEEVIQEVADSGLRGRGGAGFPTGTKWGFCRNAEGEPKYMICNADEGDPGAFMDRAVLESDPFSVIDGMTIAARAIGASHGYIYVRAEYPLGVKRLENALGQARERGLLGKGILGSDFSFDIRLKKGAGAFVCGEETALLASIEGKRGMPRPRPPFPAQKGLNGKPTNINNVETLANVPVILQKGAGWFSKYGTKGSRGTKTFALAGKVKRTGLIEVPLGMTLRETVFDIGGGIPEDKRVKAVQTGGPSGGCIPAGLLNTPVVYEKLAEAGSIMGSGGLVVMDEDTCMVDSARYFLEFTRNESCGKCAPCRLGTVQMHEILKRITRGEGRIEDLELLEQVGESVKLASLCGLGQTAPNPVLTTLRYFRKEYEDHIKRRKCPAAVCEGLVTAPCRHTCPAGVDVPRYVRYVADGRFAEALDVVLEKMPFPAVCGYVCFHPCEAKCRRGTLDDPVAVRALKRAAVELGSNRETSLPRADPTGRRVGVVGAGPAGLTAAYFLAGLGHEVTVFERESEPGGTLRTGIPAFRLPREVIDRDIIRIERAGVEIRTDEPVESVDGLFEQGYDAVLLAFGALKGRTMGIEGEGGPRVRDCLRFLRCVNAGEPVETGRRVTVVGGGSSAMDAARTALRLGAEEVTVVYRRTRPEMPASEEEVKEALEEGVKIEFLANPIRIGTDGEALAIECVRMEQGELDDSGRRQPVPVEGSEFELPADLVVMAIGQESEVLPGQSWEVDRRGRVMVDEMTRETTRPGVFAAGDVVTGPASIIEAVAAGREVARSIDRHLGGEGEIDRVLALPEEETPEMPEEQEERPRVPIPLRPARERARDFEAVELGYSEQEARREAERCLRCDLEEVEEAE